jgi:AcrR family transcriptional regulator
VVTKAQKKNQPKGDKDALRERVLRASVELIDEEGLGALSMREVARRAGVSHQAPYHYFADREAILAAIAEHGFEILSSGLVEARAKSRSATDGVERAAIAYVRFACENAAYFRIMFRPELVNVSNFHDADCSADKAFRHLPEMVMDCVKAGLPKELGGEPMIALLWSVAHGFASLLIDGPLKEKASSFVQNQDKAIRDVAKVMRRMLDATIASAQLKS